MVTNRRKLTHVLPVGHLSTRPMSSCRKVVSMNYSARRSRLGPGQPLDLFPVSPSPCLPRRTYIPGASLPASLPPATYLHPWRVSSGIPASRDVPTSL